MLGVTKPTLYAYVSRGIVGRSTAADGRTSLYAREEIQRLAGRARAQRASAPATIDVQISSRITELQDEGVTYRGHDAAELARSYSFEQVAELLWTATLGQQGLSWSADREDLSRCRNVVTAAGAENTIAKLTLAATTLAAGSGRRRRTDCGPPVTGDRTQPARRTCDGRHRHAAHRGVPPAAVTRAGRRRLTRDWCCSQITSWRRARSPFAWRARCVPTRTPRSRRGCASSAARCTGRRALLRPTCWTTPSRTVPVRRSIACSRLGSGCPASATPSTATATRDWHRCSRRCAPCPIPSVAWTSSRICSSRQDDGSANCPTSTSDSARWRSWPASRATPRCSPSPASPAGRRTTKKRSQSDRCATAASPRGR